MLKFQPYTMLFLLPTILLLQACTTVPVNRDFTTSVGFWEQDENTDPSFVVYPDFVDKVGVIYVSGDQVYVNEVQISKTSPLKNHSFVRTGPRSGARIEFDTPNSNCRINIHEFRYGKGFAHASSCRHVVVSRHAEIQAWSSVYHVHVMPEQTVVTVLRGIVVAGLRSNPGHSVTIYEGQEAILSSDSIIEPRSVPDNEIKRRIEWRNQYQFVETATNWAMLATIGAVVAATVAILVWTASDDDDSSPPSPPISLDPGTAPPDPCCTID